mmetsp:Transcript_44645/g.118155  ORF Transcript_44645/g.118155 Transcript_44645/m.118155 type:complete len:200 (+) Transcript_44645:566-1165(+)
MIGRQMIGRSRASTPRGMQPLGMPAALPGGRRGTNLMRAARSSTRSQQSSSPRTRRPGGQAAAVTSRSGISRHSLGRTLSPLEQALPHVATSAPASKGGEATRAMQRVGWSAMRKSKSSCATRAEALSPQVRGLNPGGGATRLDRSRLGRTMPTAISGRTRRSGTMLAPTESGTAIPRRTRPGRIGVTSQAAASKMTIT